MKRTTKKQLNNLLSEVSKVADILNATLKESEVIICNDFLKPTSNGDVTLNKYEIGVLELHSILCGCLSQLELLEDLQEN